MLRHAASHRAQYTGVKEDVILTGQAAAGSATILPSVCCGIPCNNDLHSVLTEAISTPVKHHFALLQVEVEPSPIFQRDGYDVVVPRTIDFTDAILGTTMRWAHVQAFRGV